MAISKSDKIFLAATGLAAASATAAIAPKILSDVQQQVQAVQEQLSQNNQIDPKDSFAAGVIVGGVAGSIGTAKVIVDKINNP